MNLDAKCGNRPTAASLSVRHIFPRLLGLPVLALLFSTTGCAIHRVHVDYVGFEKAYADTSNRELLLNLARLQNHDPTYFFKMGQITSSYRMAATVSATGLFQSQSTIAGKSNSTGSGTPGVSYESDPLFQFIPVNDEVNAQLLLKPIPPETFYILYQQGWRIDQLFRLMVDRIEVTHTTKDNCTVEIYRNVPPVVAKDSGDNLDSLQQRELTSYTGFLRASAIAYGLQRHGFLVLREVSTFVPLDFNAAQMGTSSSSGGDKTQDPGKTDSTKPLISATDFEKAAEKDLTFESIKAPQPATDQVADAVKTPGPNIVIGQRITTPKFYLIPTKTMEEAPQKDPDKPTEQDKEKDKPAPKYTADTAKIVNDLKDDQHFTAVTRSPALPADQKPPPTGLDIFLAAVQDNGFAIADDIATSDQGAVACLPGTENYKAQLILRSIIGVMAAASQEELLLDRLESPTSNPKVLYLKEAPNGVSFLDAVPPIERLPILRINWTAAADNGIALTQPPAATSITSLDYRKTHYMVADSTNPDELENEYWNRDVFRLINALTSQVTVDTSKYPIANILTLNNQ